MERLAVSKEAAHKFGGKRLNLRKLNDLEIRKQYPVEISNTFAALENISDREDINRAWENIKENIKTSAKGSLSLHRLKQHIFILFLFIYFVHSIQLHGAIVHMI